MGLATCGPYLITRLRPQFLFLLSILPPGTGVLPWIPVYLAGTHTGFFTLANSLPGAVELIDSFSLRPAPDLTGWIIETCLTTFLSCPLQSMDERLKWDQVCKSSCKSKAFQIVILFRDWILSSSPSVVYRSPSRKCSGFPLFLLMSRDIKWHGNFSNVL